VIEHLLLVFTSVLFILDGIRQSGVAAS